MAGYKEKMNLGKGLAIHALRNYYLTNQEQQKELMNLCLEKISNANMTKIFLKVQREYLNYIVVKAVLSDLIPEKQRFIKLKYKNNWSLVKIEIDLNVSKAQLCLWQTEILNLIENMLFYRLETKDYFNVNKIISILYILDQQITYLESCCIDIVDKEAIKYLKKIQQKYQELYKILNDTIESEDITKTTKVIQARVALGAVSTMLLAKEADCSIARVSTILKNYHNTLVKVMV